MSDELVGKKILIVDDDSDIRQAIEVALGETGASVDIAGDGNTAVEKITVGEPDLVVLDMMLPKRSGFLIMERIKRGKAKDEMPRVIMITGNQGSRHRVYAETLGIDVYLNKPFRMNKLVDEVKRLLS